MLEGVIPYTIHNVLKSLYLDKLITLDMINDNLQKIDFPVSSNIPVIFNKNILSKKVQ